MTSIDKLSYITNLLFNKIEDTEIDLSEEECDNIVNYSKDIRKELRQFEKLEKAVEIIKLNNVNIVSLLYAFDFVDETSKQQLKRYNDMEYDKPITQEEFDLLKEVFECN